MSTTVTITELLRNPKRIRQLTEQGLTVIVLVNGKPVFELKAFKPKKDVKTEFPKTKLNLPVKLSKKDIYEKYGAR